MRGAVGPVVAPADDDVAAGEGVPVVAEIAAFKLEFEVHALPALRTDLALGFAVGEAGLHGFDDVAQFFRDHAEQKDYALFVDGFVSKAAKIHGLAIGWSVVQGLVTNFAGRRRWRLLVRRAIFVGWRKSPWRGCLCYCGV